MSVMGTGIAAAVAQTHAAANEQKKVQNKRQREDEARSRAIREAYEVHLVSLEEGDETSARLHADGQLDNEHDTARRLELIRQYREAIAHQARQRAERGEEQADEVVARSTAPPTTAAPTPPASPPDAASPEPVRRIDIEA